MNETTTTNVERLSERIEERCEADAGTSESQWTYAELVAEAMSMFDLSPTAEQVRRAINAAEDLDADGESIPMISTAILTALTCEVPA